MESFPAQEFSLLKEAIELEVVGAGTFEFIDLDLIFVEFVFQVRNLFLQMVRIGGMPHS